MHIGDLSFPSPPPLDVLVGHSRSRGAGAIEGEQRDEVLESIRLHASDEVRHPRALQLEDAGSSSVADQSEGRLIVERDRLYAELNAGVGLERFAGILNEGEVAQSEEIELEEADGLNVDHVELRDELLFSEPEEGDMAEEFVGRDHDPCGVSSTRCA